MSLCHRLQRSLWEPHLHNLCDRDLASLCVNRQASIFTPLHYIFLALSCWELNMKMPISHHGTQSCVHSHAAGAGNTWASLWRQENLY